jgi:dienelactone hydrolase
MSYDPFIRGPHPVGVRSVAVTDTSRDRTLPIEVWYPASAAHAGEDLALATQDTYNVLPIMPETTQEAVRDAAPAEARFPLVAFSHGFGGHRRQTTHFCIHLASHGYAVVAVDHVGNTIAEMMQTMGQMGSASSPDAFALIDSFIANRPSDVSFSIDCVLDGSAGGLGDRIDGDRVGMTGHSFGGWTTLMVSGRDSRIAAALPLAPAGGSMRTDENPFADSLDLAWKREVPTLYLVADRDSLLPLDGMHELLGRTPGDPRMVVLENSDHMHFCDNVEQTHEMLRLLSSMAPPEAPSPIGPEGVPPMTELCPGEHAYAFIRGLGLAHMDAHVRGSGEAAQLLTGDLGALLKDRGVSVQVVG